LPQFGFVLISDLVDQIFNESFFRFSRGNLKISHESEFSKVFVKSA
jgi:hypothetical protein